MDETPKRRGRPPKYTDERKAEIIAIIENVYAGSINKGCAAIGVPEASVRLWYQPKSRKPDRTYHLSDKTEPMPDLPPQELIDHKRQQITDTFQRIIERYAGFIEKSDLDGQKPVQAATVVGILFDKLQIMRGQPTHITQTNVRYMEQGSLKKMARERLKVLEGGKKDDDEATG